MTTATTTSTPDSLRRGLGGKGGSSSPPREFMAFTEGVWKAYLGELAPPNAQGALRRV